MSLRTKVVFLVPGFPVDENDQNCLPYLQDLILLLKDHLGQEQIRVISFQYPFKRSNYTWNGIEVHAIGGRNRTGLFKIRTWIQVYSKLRKIKSQHGIDAIHSIWLNETALIAQIFSFFYKTPTMATIIGQDPLRSNKYLKYLKLQNIRLIAISNFVSDTLFESTGRKADDVIPLVWREDIFKNISKNSKGFDVLGVGNLSPLKNYKLFIQTIDNLIDKVPNLKCGIIGSGKQKIELLKIIKEKDLEDNIELLGETNRDEVLAIMKNSKVLLHTSNYESQGFAMSEGQYLGMKVVSTPVSDTESNQTVRVARNAQDLSAAVISALEEETRESIIHYPPEKAVEQYIHHYTSLTS